VRVVNHGLISTGIEHTPSTHLFSHTYRPPSLPIPTSSGWMDGLMDGRTSLIDHASFHAIRSPGIHRHTYIHTYTHSLSIPASICICICIRIHLCVSSPSINPHATPRKRHSHTLQPNPPEPIPAQNLFIFTAPAPAPSVRERDISLYRDIVPCTTN